MKQLKERATVHTTIGLDNAFDLVGEFGIFSAGLARRALTPGIVSADRHFEHSAHQRKGSLVPVLLNELVSHTLSREKMPTAFFTAETGKVEPGDRLQRGV
jgi:hypothetical protein